MIHSQALRLAALLVGAALLAGPGAAFAEDKVLAKVNGQEIKESDLKYAEAEIGPQLAEMPVDKRKR
ncbi:MAG: peptidylprolyl isomerase, partial [Hyphomicrobium zavarzinii]|nr:peptidylprolyl isomerase [Hyphomicrobium zavarzinii]